MIRELSTLEEVFLLGQDVDDFLPLPLSSQQTITRWVERGDGVAVYVNHDLGHRDLGLRKFVSYGSPAAQLGTDDPPQTLPDIGGDINWRYQLCYRYREEQPHD